MASQDIPKTPFDFHEAPLEHTDEMATTPFDNLPDVGGLTIDDFYDQPGDPSPVHYPDREHSTMGEDPNNSKDSNAREQSEESETFESPADRPHILERHNRTIAEILRRFNNVIMAASAPIATTGNVLEQAKFDCLTLQTETAALISAIQSLLAINREIKALWIVGPPRPPGNDSNREAELDRQAESVARLADQAIAYRDRAIRAQTQARLLSTDSGSENRSGSKAKQDSGSDAIYAHPHTATTGTSVATATSTNAAPETRIGDTIVVAYPPVDTTASGNDSSSKADSKPKLSAAQKKRLKNREKTLKAREKRKQNRERTRTAEAEATEKAGPDTVLGPSSSAANSSL
ncbi:hypothetical protein GGR54DRAFT_637335 [Hypoxylon sp. NC1633]|nr:hypothetical protein GGR54DRAFT_637335 [Hypoxylon sp. NC1633]